MADTLEQRIRMVFIKNGLWLGLTLISLSVASFYFITEISKSPFLFVAAPLVFSFVLPIITVLLFCFFGRKKIGGYWSLRQAITGIFIMFAIAYIMQTIGRDYIFAKIIEPNMIEKTEKAFLNAAAIIRKEPGANQKQLDENTAEVKQNFEDQKNVSAGKVIQGILISIILIFVLAVIFGALFKKDAPVFYTGENL